jgi:hypothetical protein
MKPSSAKILKAAIQECLGGPRGDPDRSNLYPAACMAKVLLDEGFKVDKNTLSGVQKDNMYDHDFLNEVEEEFAEKGKNK